MSVWVIPYVDQPLEFWQEVHTRFGDQVKGVYCPAPAGAFSTGRSRQPERYLEDFLRRAPLDKSILVNAIVLARPVEEMAPGVIAALQRMHGDFGIRSVTVANPALARSIKEALPDLSVAASVLMGIRTALQALVVRDWVDVIAPDTSLVRDLRALGRLRSAFSGEVRLLVNEACIAGCPYRTQHFYEMGHGTGYPKSLCDEMLLERPWLRLTGSWILPRHLDHYGGLYDTLKLAGRVTLRDPDRYLSVLGSYVNHESILPKDIGGGPASPLEPLDVTDEWFEQVLSCDKRCDICEVCQKEYERALQA
jgi:collagenase-like PrtC family protease